MTTATVEWRVEKSKGYSRMGHMARKSYVAQVLGTDEQYGLAREFREADEIDWGDSKLFKRNKGIWHEIHRVGHGLYEVCLHGDREYRIVYSRKSDGTTAWSKIDESRAKAIAKLMDDGLDYDDARHQTMAAKEPSND